MCNDTTTTELYCCDCGQSEHLMMVDHYYWGENTEPEFSISIYLNHNKGFLRRLENAMRYVMGKKSRYGAFDSLLLGNGDVRRLRDSCNAFLLDASLQKGKGEDC